VTSSKRRPSLPPTQVSPAAMPLELEETKEAKKYARGHKRGRPSTILAGRLMSEHGKMLLGE